MKLTLPVIFLGVSNLICAQNLLDNPSFEEGSPVNSALPADWSSVKFLSMENHHFLDTATARSGKSSAMLTSRKSEGVKHYILWMQRGLGKKLFNIDGGTEMEFSAWVKTDSPKVKIRIYLEASKTANSKYYSVISPEQSIPEHRWKKVTLRFKLPDEKPDYYACLQLLTKGTVWFDDVYFGKASEAPLEKNRLENASMEDPGAGTRPAAEWQTMQLNLRGTFHSVDRMAHSGEKSLKITCNEPSLKASHFLLWIQKGVEKRLSDCPPGTEMELSVWSNTLGNPGVKYRFYMEMQKKTKYIGTFSSGELTNYVGWQKKSLRFKMPAEIPDSAYVCLQLLSPGSVCFDDVSLEKVPASKDGQKVASQRKPLSAKSAAEYGECRVTNFPPRQIWYLPEKPRELNLSLLLPPDAEGKIRVTLQDKEGRNLASRTFTGKKEAVFPLPVLDKGAYILKYEAGSYQDEEFFHIADAAEKQKGIRFTSDHRAFFNGKPFFPIMVMSPKMDEEAFRIYQDAGFNCIAPFFLTSDLQAGRFIAETAARYNLLCCTWIGIGDRRQALGEDKYKAFIRKQISNARAMPNFFAFLDDESEMREVSPIAMKQAYKEVYLNAPEFAVWQNHAPRMTGKSGQKYGNFDNVKRFSAACDVTGVDIYPVPEGNFHSELDNKTLSCVGDFTDLAAKTVYHKKPVWMVLQGSGWGEMTGGTLNERQPRPDYLQTRFMVYNAVTHGARGIAMFGRHAMEDVYSPYFAMLSDVMKELKVVAAFIMEGKELELNNGELPDAVRMQAWKKDGDEIAVVAVNESGNPVAFRASLDKIASEWYSSPSGRKENPGKIFLPAYGVAIFMTKCHEIPKTALYKPLIGKPEVQSPQWKAQWVTHPKHYTSKNQMTRAKHEFMLDKVPEQATIHVTGDNTFRFYIGEKEIGSGSTHLFAFAYDISRYLKPGRNVLEFELWNEDGPSGLLYEGKIGGKEILSGLDTLFSDDGGKTWVPAAAKGVPPVKPWGEVQLLQSHK